MRSGREYPPRPLVGAGALIHRKGRVLLVQRKNPPNKGRWALPGGLVELGETAREAAAREVKEELGIRVRLEGLLDVADSVHLDARGKVRYHYVLVDYLARPLTTKVRLNAESSSYGWFRPHEVEGLDASEDTKEVIRRFQRIRVKR